MPTFLIIIGIIAGIIGVFLISNKLGVNKLIEENKEICAGHEEMGYPELEREIQLRIMETGDLSPIANLIPELKSKGTPLCLLKHYIKVTKEEFKDYLRSTNFLEKNRIENAPNPLHDGIWIRGNEIINQEHGHILYTWEITNDKDAIDIYGDLLWGKIYF